MSDAVIRFFQSGGSFMYPILVVLAIGLSITLERYVYLTIVKIKNRRLLSRIMPMLQKGEMNSVIKLTRASDATVSRILLRVVNNLKQEICLEDIEAAIEESIMEATPRLQKRTHYLAMFANIATLLGLLGTIIGLIKAFTAIAQVAPAMKAEILSASISVAMNTTAFGLIVAIPLLIFYTLLQSKTTEIIDSLEVTALRFVNQLSKFKNARQQDNAR